MQEASFPNPSYVSAQCYVGRSTLLYEGDFYYDQVIDQISSLVFP